MNHVTENSILMDAYDQQSIAYIAIACNTYFLENLL